MTRVTKRLKVFLTGQVARATVRFKRDRHIYSSICHHFCFWRVVSVVSRKRTSRLLINVMKTPFAWHGTINPFNFSNENILWRSWTRANGSAIITVGNMWDQTRRFGAFPFEAETTVCRIRLGLLVCFALYNRRNFIIKSRVVWQHGSTCQQSLVTSLGARGEFSRTNVSSVIEIRRGHEMKERRIHRGRFSTQGADRLPLASMDVLLYSSKVQL